jgi:elongation factor 1-beta
MARVAVVLKVFPSDASIQPSQLAERIKRSLPNQFEVLAEGEEPIAFGLKALKLVVAIPEDIEGGTEKLEEAIRSVDGVDEVEIESVSRMQ